jgi:hypothetical protein
MSEKRKSASPSAIQVKSRRKTIGIIETLRVIMRRENVNELLVHAIMVDSLMVSFLKFVIRLTELQKGLSQARVTRLPQSYPSEPYQKLWMCVSYTFIALEINKYIYIL